MDEYLKCKVAEGMFSTECIVLIDALYSPLNKEKHVYETFIDRENVKLRNAAWEDIKNGNEKEGLLKLTGKPIIKNESALICFTDNWGNNGNYRIAVPLTDIVID